MGEMGWVGAGIQDVGRSMGILYTGGMLTMVVGFRADLWLRYIGRVVEICEDRRVVVWRKLVRVREVGLCGWRTGTRGI